MGVEDLKDQVGRVMAGKPVQDVLSGLRDLHNGATQQQQAQEAAQETFRQELHAVLEDPTLLEMVRMLPEKWALPFLRFVAQDGRGNVTQTVFLAIGKLGQDMLVTLGHYGDHVVSGKKWPGSDAGMDDEMYYGSTKAEDFAKQAHTPYWLKTREYRLDPPGLLANFAATMATAGRKAVEDMVAEANRAAEEAKRR